MFFNTSSSTPRFEANNVYSLKLNATKTEKDLSNNTKFHVEFKDTEEDRTINLSMTLKTWVDPRKVYTKTGTPEEIIRQAVDDYNEAVIALYTAADQSRGMKDQKQRMKDLAPLFADVDAAEENLPFMIMDRKEFDRFMAAWMQANELDGLSKDYMVPMLTVKSVVIAPELYGEDSTAGKEYAMHDDVQGKPVIKVVLDDTAFFQGLTKVFKKLVGTQAWVLMGGEKTDKGVYARLRTAYKVLSVLSSKVSSEDAHKMLVPNDKLITLNYKLKKAAKAASTDTEEDSNLPF